MVASSFTALGFREEHADKSNDNVGGNGRWHFEIACNHRGDACGLGIGRRREAQDKLKVVIGQINNWENQVPTLGVQAGIFKKHGLELETLGTQGAGETLQPIISGSADIGIGVGTSGAMRVFVQGAPVRALAAGFTGTNDLFWYVRADSPIKSLKDLTESHTIAYSTSGSASNNIVLGFVKVLGVKARPTPDRRPARDAHHGHVQAGRRGLGRAAARRPGGGRGQDQDRRARQRPAPTRATRRCASWSSTPTR